MLSLLFMQVFSEPDMPDMLVVKRTEETLFANRTTPPDIDAVASTGNKVDVHTRAANAMDYFTALKEAHKLSDAEKKTPIGEFSIVAFATNQTNILFRFMEKTAGTILSCVLDMTSIGRTTDAMTADKVQESWLKHYWGLWTSRYETFKDALTCTPTVASANSSTTASDNEEDEEGSEGSSSNPATPTVETPQEAITSTNAPPPVNSEPPVVADYTSRDAASSLLCSISPEIPDRNHPDERLTYKTNLTGLFDGIATILGEDWANRFLIEVFKRHKEGTSHPYRDLDVYGTSGTTLKPEAWAKLIACFDAIARAIKNNQLDTDIQDTYQAQLEAWQQYIKTFETTNEQTTNE